MVFDNKKEWHNKKKDLYLRIMQSSYLPSTIKVMVSKYQEGLWETPKTYIDGYAYNDGSWVIYNTCRVKNGKFRNKILCRTRKDVINQLYSYICFLKKIGMTNVLEIGYFVSCHIIYKLIFKEGLFNPDGKVLDTIEKLINSIKNNDVVCERLDTRKYCLDPDLKNKMDVGQKTTLQRTKDKELTWSRIDKLYDDKLTNQQNLDKFKEHNLNISESTLQRWKRTHKGGVSNGF